MIDDWVKLNDSNCQVQVIKKKGVIKLYENTKYGEHDVELNTDWIEEFIEPIPLTKEILERNSFLKVESIEYPSHSVGVSFLYRNTPEGLRIFVQNACVGGPTCTMIKTCKYVHEVQHMIKMCDIGKNIVL